MRPNLTLLKNLEKSLLISCLKVSVSFCRADVKKIFDIGFMRQKLELHFKLPDAFSYLIYQIH